MIPREIYRTWPSETLPLAFLDVWNRTQNANPGFRQHLFTDDAMVAFMCTHFARDPVCNGRVLRAFLSINPLYGTARADLFRYALIFKRGGVYLDAKSAAFNISRVFKPKDTFLVAHWGVTSVVRLWSQLHLRNMAGEYQQW